MRGFRLEISVPNVNIDREREILTARRFFNRSNETINPGQTGEYWFHCSERAENEAFEVLDYYEKYFRMHEFYSRKEDAIVFPHAWQHLYDCPQKASFDSCLRVRYEDIPDEEVIYSDELQFVRRVD